MRLKVKTEKFRTHWVEWGPGRPKDRYEEKKRDVWECEVIVRSRNHWQPSILIFVYYNGEGQIDEGWGYQGPSHTGLIIIHTTSQVSIHRFLRRSRKPLWVRVSETKEPECTWEWGVWAWGGCGCVSYSVEVRYTIVIRLRKIRHKDWGDWTAQKTKGPECKWEWEGGPWAWNNSKPVLCVYFNPALVGLFSVE